MRVYSTREFVGLLLVSGIVGGMIVGSTTWVVNTFFSPGIPTVYHQIVCQPPWDEGKIMSYPWAQVNHTIIILNGTVIDSMLNVTAVLEPPRDRYDVNFTVKLLFSFHRYNATLSPTLIDGTLSWSGDLRVNQSKMLHTTFALDKGDGVYYIYGGAGWVGYFQTEGGETSRASEGYGTRHWIKVEDGKIVKVMDYSKWLEWKQETGNTEIDAETDGE